MAGSLLTSILHNLFVIAVGLGVGLFGTGLDASLGLNDFRSVPAAVVGILLLALGFLVRVWAAFHFYQHQMIVISLEPQNTLISTGPYRYSRNPLYLGGNVFIFFGAAFLLGSPAALAITLIHLPLMDWFIRGEEKQLEQSFGDEWRSYKQRVRRWI